MGGDFRDATATTHIDTTTAISREPTLHFLISELQRVVDQA